jgi:hypothetical protein
MLKKEIVPSLLIVLMGTIDCVTTAIGVLYFGAKELNPFMAGIVSTDIGAFLAVKITATTLVALSYILANKILSKTQNKSGKSFNISNKMLKVGYCGIIVFLFIVVANNLMILLA